MIVREKEILINGILLELKNKEDIVDENIKKSIINKDFSEIEDWIAEFGSNQDLKKLNKLLEELLELKEKNQIVEIWDDFLVGHCHDFAVALNILFGYKIGIIEGSSKGIFGEDLKHLFHAFALDEKNQAYDVEGKYSYEGAISNYKTQKNPKTGNIAKEVSVRFFNGYSEFLQEFDLVKNNEDFIIKAIKRISSNPLVYYESKREKSNYQLPVLEVNKNYLPSGDQYYGFKERKRIYQKFSLKCKKYFKNLKLWSVNSVDSTFDGFNVKLGLGSYDFDIVSISFNINWEGNDSLSDLESEGNILSYFNDFNLNSISKDILSSIN